MVKKALITILVFYLLGVFGVAAGYLSNSWDSEWGLSQQAADAIQLGVAWPKLVIDLMTGA